MTLERFLERLEGVEQNGSRFQALCPAHADRTPSLSIRQTEEGKILLHCFAGCRYQEILAALGLTPADLFPASRKQRKARARTQSQPVATYDYRDADGVCRFQTVRFEPKAFRQRRPDGRGGWIWNLDGVALLPYKLPELLRADPADWVFLVEGEKDVLRLQEEGLVATCNPLGAGKWRDHYSEPLRGRRCGVLPDHDEPGRRHGEQVAASLLRHGAAEVRVVELPGLPPGGDVSDWLAAGNPVAALREQVEQARPWTPPDREAATAAPVTVELAAEETLSDFADWVHRRLNERNSRETRRQVTERIRGWLLERGRLLRDRQTSECYLLTDTHAVVSLAQNGLELRAMLAAPGLNPAEPLFEWLRADLEVAAFRAGREVRLSHGAARNSEGALCVSCGPTRYVEARAGEPFSLRLNGENGVLFARETAFPEWNPQASPVAPGEVPAFRPNLVAPPEVLGYTPERQRQLLLTWLAGVVAGLRPLPLLAVLGNRGGGKSSLCRAIVQTFYGPTANVAALSADERDFWTLATRRVLLSLDNVDAPPPPWFADALAAVTTGTRRPTRRLYTDSEVADREAGAALLINSRTATFCRADVAERMVPLFVDDLGAEQRVSDSDLAAAVAAHRDGVLVYLVTQAAATWQRQKAAPQGLPARFLDFARWMWGGYAARGEEREAVPALLAWRQAQSLAVIEADELLLAIVTHAPQLPEEALYRKTATELLAMMASVAEEKLPYFGPGRGLTNRLRELRSSLRLCGWQLSLEARRPVHLFTLKRVWD